MMVVPKMDRTESLRRRQLGEQNRRQVARSLARAYGFPPTISMDDLMDRLDPTMLRKTIGFISDVYYGGRFLRLLRSRRVSLRVFVRDDAPPHKKEYAATEWGGRRPVHVIVWTATFRDAGRVYARGCRKRIDGNACDAPLEFFVGVVAHELIHVLLGGVQGFAGAHTKRFDRHNQYFNGAKPREFTNSTQCK